MRKDIVEPRWTRFTISAYWSARLLWFHGGTRDQCEMISHSTYAYFSSYLFLFSVTCIAPPTLIFFHRRWLSFSSGWVVSCTSAIKRKNDIHDIILSLHTNQIENHNKFEKKNECIHCSGEQDKSLHGCANQAGKVIRN